MTNALEAKSDIRMPPLVYLELKTVPELAGSPLARVARSTIGLMNSVQMWAVENYGTPIPQEDNHALREKFFDDLNHDIGQIPYLMEQASKIGTESPSYPKEITLADGVEKKATLSDVADGYEGLVNNFTRPRGRERYAETVKDWCYERLVVIITDENQLQDFLRNQLRAIRHDIVSPLTVHKAYIGMYRMRGGDLNFLDKKIKGSMVRVVEIIAGSFMRLDGVTVERVQKEQIAEGLDQRQKTTVPEMEAAFQKYVTNQITKYNWSHNRVTFYTAISKEVVDASGKIDPFWLGLVMEGAGDNLKKMLEWMAIEKPKRKFVIELRVFEENGKLVLKVIDNIQGNPNLQEKETFEDLARREGTGYGNSGIPTEGFGMREKAQRLKEQGVKFYPLNVRDTETGEIAGWEYVVEMDLIKANKPK